MYLTLVAKLFKHSPCERHAWACLTRCTTTIHPRHNHNKSTSRNRPVLMRGVNIPREMTRQDVAKIFEDNELGVTVISESDVTLINKKKFFRTCYIHGLHIGELELAQKLLAEHNFKLNPVLSTTVNPEHQKLTYVFAKAVNLPTGSSEQDIFQLFKGWVHEESHVYPLYGVSENQGQLLTECYAAMPFDTYQEAKPALLDNHDIQLSVHSNTVHARQAIRDMERFSTEKHVLLLRNMPEGIVTLEKLTKFLDLQPTLLQRFEDYWFVSFSEREEAVAAFENVDWMKEFNEDVQLKLQSKMRKFTTNTPFRFDFWKHRERTILDV